MSVALLIDGDIIAYKHASASEVPIEWTEDLWTLHAHADLAKRAVDSEIASLQEATGADSVVVALSDKANFRKALYPEYKATRAKNRKPILLAALRDYLLNSFDAYVRPGLEADDVLGILATHNTLVRATRKIIVSIDKDFKAVPCTLWNNRSSVEDIRTITPAEADRNHLLQTITGDASDNYPGCPGIGPKRAEDIVTKALASDDPWEVIVSVFVKAGLTADDALLQARLARILRADEYDFTAKQPVLWTPDKLKQPAKAAGKRKHATRKPRGS